MMPHGTSPKESISSPRPELYLELGRVRLGYPFGFGFFALLLKPSGTSRSRAHREVLRIAKFFVSRSSSYREVLRIATPLHCSAAPWLVPCG